MKNIHQLITTCIILLSITLGCTENPQIIQIDTDNLLVQKFYEVNQQQVFWFTSKKQIRMANEWLDVLESAHRYGIETEASQIKKIRTALLEKNTIQCSLRDEVEQQLTGMVLNFIKELQEGLVHFDYDDVSINRDSIYVNRLLHSTSRKPVQQLVFELDCKTPAYQTLKRFLNDSISRVDTFKYQSVIKTMNYLRYFSVFAPSEYLVANIPETEARYYRNGLLAIHMRTVVGRKKTPTPTIASYINMIITYPTWNVPHSIAVKEILPKVQKDEIYLEQNNLSVVDAKGIEVEDLDWSKYTEKSFPYFFRQSKGAMNALGVLKFNFENPYSVYMHSTNSQSGFLRNHRFLSHGCIRLEKPIELATNLLRGKLNIEALKTGEKTTKSEQKKLDHKVPVFIIYALVSIEGDSLVFLPDIYGLN